MKIDPSKFRPFVGSDEGWKHYHGKNWKKARKNYIKESLSRLDKFKKK